jgi:hypothetical protein
LDRVQTEATTFGIAANVCAADTAMILHTIPSWLRVFRDQLSEILLVVDEALPSGRIASQHKNGHSNKELYAAIEYLERLDHRVRHRILDYSCALRTSQKWFHETNLLRCQAGTPIFAFLQAIEESSGDIVLRTDSDMFFFDAGWVDRAIELLQSKTVDLVEPPRLGTDLHPYQTAISTRAFLVKRSQFTSRCLPLRAYRLDLARRLHRALNGRPAWLALEQMLEKEKDRGRIRHALLDCNLGFSIHVHDREYPPLEEFERIVSAIESGSVPAEQVSQGWNLVLQAWPSSQALPHSVEIASQERHSAFLRR